MVRSLWKFLPMLLVAVVGCSTPQPTKPPTPPAHAPTFADASGTLVSGNTVTKSADDAKCAEPSCNPVDTIVMHKVQVYLHVNPLDEDSAERVWITTDYSDAARAKYQRHQANVAKLRAWADTLPEGHTRSAYETWCDYYDSQAQKAIDEIATRTIQHRQEEFERHERECNEASRAYSRTHRVPTPPQP